MMPRDGIANDRARPMDEDPDREAGAAGRLGAEPDRPATAAGLRGGRLGRRAVVARSAVAAICLPAAGAWGLRALASSPTFQVCGDLVHRVETRERVVALTFDDGPAPGRTREILAILRRCGVRATFFVVGAQADAFPAAAAAIAAAGHQLGNHSWSHARLVFRSPAFVRAEVERGAASVRAAGGPARPVFRPPYGKKLFVLPFHLRQQGITTVTWDVAPDDDPTRGADAIAAETLARVRPGSIVVLHPWYPNRAASFAAIEPTVEALRAAEYRFVTIDELLALAEKPG